MDLRQTITAATNKSEAFNGFTKWVGFGGHGVITENSREEQRKFIKYNHLISSLVILYTVNSMTHVLNELTLEGVKIDSEILAKLSPYRTHYINRFGDYFMRLLDCTNSMQLTLPGFETEVA